MKPFLFIKPRMWTTCWVRGELILKNFKTREQHRSIKNDLFVSIWIYTFFDICPSLRELNFSKRFFRSPLNDFAHFFQVVHFHLYLGDTSAVTTVKYKIRAHDHSPRNKRIVDHSHLYSLFFFAVPYSFTIPREFCNKVEVTLAAWRHSTQT